MVEFGLLTEDQLAKALAAQQRDRRPLGELLVALGFASSGAVHDALTEQHGWSGGSEFGFGGRLKEITAPAVFVLGERSPMPVSQGEQTAALLPGAEVRVVPGAGHLPWHERPGCVADAAGWIRTRASC